jgi:drug/metabolite transporter (DMT)-like permease
MGGKYYLNSRPMVYSTTIHAVLLCIWFSCSVLSTLTNKLLMLEFPYPITISAIHMLSSVVVDIAILYKKGYNHYPLNQQLILSSIPVAMCINAGKVLTYFSYGLVPASLTHTAKASAPVFSVAASKILLNHVPKLNTCLSLIPITLGVILCAANDLELQFLGFFAAVAASLAQVLNSIFTKKALGITNNNGENSTTIAPDPLVYHMYTAGMAVLILFPLAAIIEFHAIYNGYKHDHVTIDQPAIVYPYNPSTLILFSLLFHYAQNLSSIYYLDSVTVLTHTVAQSMKRFLVIGCSLLYFHTKVNKMNFMGIGLALLGFFSYSMAKQAESPKKLEQTPSRSAGSNGLIGSANNNNINASGPNSNGGHKSSLKMKHLIADGRDGYNSESESTNRVQNSPTIVNRHVVHLDIAPSPMNQAVAAPQPHLTINSNLVNKDTTQRTDSINGSPNPSSHQHIK